MSKKTREFVRTISFPAGTWGGFPLNVPWRKVYTGYQVTESEGHKRSRDGKYYEGGPFYTARVDIDVPSVNIDVSTAGEYKHYAGPACISGVPTDGKALLGTKKDPSYLDPIGTEAISAVDPLNPNAQTGVALGEIVKDRRLSIPGISTWRHRTRIAKAAGSEYLSAVFGWLPLVRDMKNTAQSVTDGNTILENYRGAAGQNNRREFSFPDIVTTSDTYLGNLYPTMGTGDPDFQGSSVPVTRHTETVTRRWFSGAFTYTADSGGSSVGQMLGYTSEAQKLYGLSLTPDLVWELTPWSWAIDWFSNASSVIHNLGSFGLAGLAMRYGYVMETVTTTHTYSMPPQPFKRNGLPVEISIPPATVTITVKQRREATPFGFGLSWDGFSPTQMAITAALGITRLR